MSNKNTIEVIVYEVKRDMGNGLTVTLRPHIFEDACQKMGVDDPGAKVYFSACLYFCRCAHHSIDLMTRQVKLEEETDDTASLWTLMESCMVNYGCTDVEQLSRFFPLARRYAFQTQKAWNPRFQAWIDSAGRAYDEQTREEKARNDN